jgi:hypothetical protein
MDPDRRSEGFQAVLTILGRVESDIPSSQAESRAWWEAHRDRLAPFW